MSRSRRMFWWLAIIVLLQVGGGCRKRVCYSHKDGGIRYEVCKMEEAPDRPSLRPDNPVILSNRK